MHRQIEKMRLVQSLGLVAVSLSSAVSAASQWTFDDATLSVATKGSEAQKLQYV